MLIAECSQRYRAVYAFGPVSDVSRYGAASGFLPFDMANQKENIRRSPGYWLLSIQSPIWVFEGALQGNIAELRKVKAASTNPKIHFFGIDNATHFTSLAPTNSLIATKILAGTGYGCSITISEDEVNRNFDGRRSAETNQ